MTTVAQYFAAIRARLAAILGSAGEGDAAARVLLEDIAGYDRKYLFMNGDREILPFTMQKVDAAVAAVAAGEPVQYAAGKALFMGMMLKVTPAVLIPRFETEGLVDMITDAAGTASDLRVLDIGTGSGCIAIALARALAFPTVTAVDVSVDALAVARDNAAAMKVTVDFRRLDILTATPPAAPAYDIVVSNPPYVTDSERADMDPRVADHEPAAALFVPDSDPMRFYRAIAAYAAAALVPGGRLYLEINQNFPEQVRAVLAEAGFADIAVSRDYRGNFRYATACRPARQ